MAGDSARTGGSFTDRLQTLRLRIEMLKGIDAPRRSPHLLRNWDWRAVQIIRQHTSCSEDLYQGLRPAGISQASATLPSTAKTAPYMKTLSCPAWSQSAPAMRLATSCMQPDRRAVPSNAACAQFLGHESDANALPDGPEYPLMQAIEDEEGADEQDAVRRGEAEIGDENDQERREEDVSRPHRSDSEPAG